MGTLASEPETRRERCRALGRSAPGARALTLARCAGLTLLSENAPQQVALRQAIEAVVCDRSDRRTTPPTRQSLRRWLKEASRGVRQLPLPGLQCEELVVDEGAFRVFPGIFEDEGWVLQMILDLVLRDERLPHSFRREARDCALGVLDLSEAVAHRAEIARNTPNDHDAATPVVPTEKQLLKLSAAVTFSEKDLGAALTPERLRHLDDLTLELGSVRPSEAEEDSELWRRPLVRCDGLGTIVALPDTLLLAARHRIIRLAFEHDCVAQLAETFGLGVIDAARSSLAQIGMLADGPPPPDAQPSFDRAEMILPCDSDKVCHLLVVWDDLADYDIERPQAQWQGVPEATAMEQRLDDVALALFSDEDPPNEVMHCVIVQSFGRPYQLVVDSPGPPTFAPRLVLSASELETISRLEQPDITLPWKFAEAVARLRGMVPLAPISQLEEWAFWRQNLRSFGFLEAGVPPSPAVQLAGFASQMREELAMSEDPHGVLAPTGKFVEVTRFWPDPAVPVVAAGRPSSLSPVVVVEGLGIPAWVLPAETPADPREVFEYRRYGELLAYWVWQLAGSTRPLWQALTTRASTVQIEITLQSTEVEGWRVVMQAPGHLSVTFGADISERMGGAENTSERQLVREVLGALCESAGKTGGSYAMDGDELDAAVIHGMEPASKRKMMFISVEDPAFEPLDVPYRTLSDAPAMTLRRSTGVAVATLRQLDVGPIEPDETGPVLNDAVAEVFRELCALVASLQGRHLLEWLVSFNEALIHRYTVDQVEQGVAIALWDPDSPVRKRSAEDTAEAARTAIASRFLIEYVTAQPPSGLRPISYEVYDELMAMAAVITDWGSASDLVREGLAELNAAILPTGHLFYGRGRYEAGALEFMEMVTRARPLRAADWLAATMTAEKVPNLSDAIDVDPFGELDMAWVAETGYTFSDCVRALAVISGFDSSPLNGAGSVGYAEAVTLTASALGWEQKKSTAIIEHFALRARRDFLDAPEGFTRADLWPWRFNRRLSYLRRPLLIRPGADGEELVFGPRQLFMSVGYLEDLVQSGRLKAFSSPLKDHMSKIQQARSRAFNDVVARVYSDAGLRARVRVQRAGAERLRDGEGNDLGDIDVLVVDEARRTILCVEVKDLAGALAPHQLANELRHTFGVGGPHRSHAEKHVRRVQWVDEHKGDVLHEFDISAQDARRWRAKGLIVTNEEVLAPFVANPPLPVRDFLTLKAAIAVGSLC
jgi:hypothetical protein